MQRSTPGSGWRNPLDYPAVSGMAGTACGGSSPPSSGIRIFEICAISAVGSRFKRCSHATSGRMRTHSEQLSRNGRSLGSRPFPRSMDTMNGHHAVQARDGSPSNKTSRDSGLLSRVVMFFSDQRCQPNCDVGFGFGSSGTDGVGSKGSIRSA